MKWKTCRSAGVKNLNTDCCKSSWLLLFLKIASCTQETEKLSLWTCLLKDNQVWCICDFEYLTYIRTQFLKAWFGLEVSNLCLETRGSWFDSCHWQWPEVSSLQYSSSYCLSVCDASGNGRVDLEMASPFPCYPLKKGNVSERKQR